MKQSTVNSETEQLHCYHCGDTCGSEIMYRDNKSFCCQGCRLVYELLQESNMCDYYALNETPGISPETDTDRYAYLNNPAIADRLIHFRSGEESHVAFYIPGMHCSSCIWLLENLARLQDGIQSSRVDFLKKEVQVVFDEKRTRLSDIAGVLRRVGYAPFINLSDLDKEKAPVRNYAPLIRIGVAGFCFGNIMMLSFPEYFSLGEYYDQETLKPFLGYTNLLLSLPVFFYCAAGFFRSAWGSLRQKHLNIDAPIALAIVVTFIRSVYEIVSGSGAGYLDSMSGIVFFMLLGRYFQNVTYETLSFNRDYRSYFPVAVELMDGETAAYVPVKDLKVGQRIRIRSNEIIPADAILLSANTHIDYSFVTGESKPVRKNEGEHIYAGARQLEGAIELEITREVSQSYLTSLWNSDKTGKTRRSEAVTFVSKVNTWFTAAVLTIAFASLGFWLISDPAKAINAFTAVLIVACPCGLLLVSTFTNAAMLRVFGRNKLYLKNAEVIEKLARADAWVFDKTGTLTAGSEVRYVGSLDDETLALAAALCSQSTHPLSRSIASGFASGKKACIHAFEELPGLGIRGEVNGRYLVIGSAYFIYGLEQEANKLPAGCVFVLVDGRPSGYFRVNNALRPDLDKTISDLRRDHACYLLSGDQETERGVFSNVFETESMFFEQSPSDKLRFIEHLQEKGHRVVMLGDGLNDGAALKQSDVGIAVSDETNTFTPASDAILDGSAFHKLAQFIRFAKGGRKVIAAVFVFSLVYNLIGLFFAVQGTLQPVIAAILMPSSTLSIILLTTVSTGLLGRYLFKK